MSASHFMSEYTQLQASAGKFQILSQVFVKPG
jgi:hypothetical protein